MNDDNVTTEDTTDETEDLDSTNAAALLTTIGLMASGAAICYGGHKTVKFVKRVAAKTAQKYQDKKDGVIEATIVEEKETKKK